MPLARRKYFGPADGATADPSTDVSASETLEAFKAGGNELFKRGKYVQAEAVYSQCLELSGQSEDVLSNLSIVHLKLSEWAAALDAAQQVLAADPTHVKCLYRAGAAHIKAATIQTSSHMLHKCRSAGDLLATDCNAGLTKTRYVVKQGAYLRAHAAFFAQFDTYSFAASRAQQTQQLRQAWRLPLKCCGSQTAKLTPNNCTLAATTHNRLSMQVILGL